MTLFSEEVAIVTGAGRGLGRVYAMHLAANGVRMIVNDLGGSMAGDGADTAPAEETRDLIRSQGGTAEANTDDITNPHSAQRIVDQALATYGRLDIVVNNAGIYGMEKFPEVELDVMRRHFDVHVGGSFNVTRAAWPHLLSAPHGRVVLATSTGMLGADNYVPYGTAKAGVIGLGRSLATVADGTNVRVNMIAPHAITGMTLASVDAGMGASDNAGFWGGLAPDLVAPAMLMLCHPKCPVNGEIVVSGMRRQSRLFISESEGVIEPEGEITMDAILAHWSAIADSTNAAELPNLECWSARFQSKFATAEA